MTKYFILDTNVILSSGSGGGSKVLYGFQSGKDSNVVVITGTVLQELDNKKTAPGEIGYNARDFIRALDDLRAKGDLTKGVILEKGAVMVEPDGVDANLLPVGFSLDRADNRIISTCIFLAKKYPKQRFVYVSNDVSCRCNADICFRAAGVKVAIEGYKNDRIDSDEEYKGYEIINDRECPGLVQALFEDTENNGVPIENSGGLYENEYLYFEESKIVTVYQDKQEIVKSNFGQNKLSEDVAPRPRYVDATDLAVTISVDCAKQAVAAMRALRELLTGERPVLLVRITDDGTRELSTYKSKEAAAMAMHTEMDIYINEIEPKDYSQIVYVDDGEDGPHLHDTTPPEQVAEDGTLKRPSEMDNTLHRIETDDRGIVYFETKNATSRWDIYDMNDAMIGDPSDPEYDGFKEKMMESAKEKAEENQEPKKKKTKTAKKSNMFGKKQ